MKGLCPRDTPDTDEETVEAFVNMDMDDPQRVMREFRKHLNAVERMGPVREPRARCRGAVSDRSASLPLVPRRMYGPSSSTST